MRTDFDVLFMTFWPFCLVGHMARGGPTLQKEVLLHSTSLTIPPAPFPVTWAAGRTIFLLGQFLMRFVCAVQKFCFLYAILYRVAQKKRLTLDLN